MLESGHCRTESTASAVAIYAIAAGGQAISMLVTILLAVAAHPALFAAADYADMLHPADYTDVPRRLAAACPAWFALTRLLERLRGDGTTALTSDDHAWLAAREFAATSRRMTPTMITGAKLVAFAITITILSTASYAGDATWLSCKGIAAHGDKAPRRRMYLVASLVEHRADDGASRDLDVTLIKGGHVGQGTIHGDQSGALEVRNVIDKHPVTFTGTAQLTEDMKTFTLAGKLDITFGADPKAKPVRLDAKLACEPLDDLAIGH